MTANAIGAAIAGLLLAGFFGVCAVAIWREGKRDNEPENYCFAGICAGFGLIGLDVIVNANAVAAGPHYRDIFDHPDGIGWLAAITAVVSFVCLIITIMRDDMTSFIGRQLAQQYLRQRSIDWIDPKCGCQRKASEALDSPCFAHRERPWIQIRHFQPPTDLVSPIERIPS